MTEILDPEPTGVNTPPEQALYRFFDEGGSLLYVGVSIHPFARMGQHKHDKSWWGEVASTTIERFPDRKAVLEAERTAIVTEKPRYNIVHAARRHKSVPRERFRYTYWEPSVGGTVTVYNVLPLHPAALVITCESCWLNFVARDITDHGGDDFLVLGKCECGRSQVAILPKRHPWDDHLSEKLPCAMVRDA